MCEEMKFCKILDLNVKAKNEENTFWPIVTVNCEDEVLEYDNRAGTVHNEWELLKIKTSSFNAPSVKDDCI